MAYTERGRNTTQPFMDSSSPRRSFIELRGAIVDVGILRDTLLPTFALHSGLSLAAWAIGRSTDDFEAKDWLVPSSHLVNAWWASVGRRIVYGKLSPLQALGSLSRPEYLLLGGVTIWASQKLYGLASRRQPRGRGRVVYDKDEYWNAALYDVFLPRAAIQTIVTLPLTAPFYHQGGVFTGYHPWIQAFSIAVFGTGLALQGFADYQLDQYNKSSKKDAKVNREGVYGMVRHPSALADFLIHASFPILLFSSDMLAPIELLGPLANYFYLHYISTNFATEFQQVMQYSSDKKASYEAYRDDQDINAFWPSLKQFSNSWLWKCIGLGVAFAAVEQVVHQLGLD